MSRVARGVVWKGTEIIDVFEVVDARNSHLLLNKRYLHNKELRYDLEFLEDTGTKGSLTMTVFDAVPKRCKNARPCVRPGNEPVDALEYVKRYLREGLQP